MFDQVVGRPTSPSAVGRSVSHSVDPAVRLKVNGLVGGSVDRWVSQSVKAWMFDNTRLSGCD